MDDRAETHRRMVEDDKRHLWHPFTQMRDWESEEPLVIERGKGCYLYDDLGNKYLDGVSSLWVTVHGHRKPEIDAAVKAQLGRVAHTTMLGLTHPAAVVLAKRLAGTAPGGLTRVFYSDSGSTAVEIAIKMAFQYWKQAGEPKKSWFMCLEEAYHGDTIGSVSVGGMGLFHGIFEPLLFDTIKAPAPYCYRCPMGKTHPDCGLACAEELGRLMELHAHRLAGFIFEPLVQGAAGMITQPPGYLRRVRELCDTHGVLMIADEVATGFGRTGRMFACDNEGVAPDIMCLAKGITGGYLPLAATLTTERIYQGFLADYSEMRTFFHGHTYTGNPLACAAAIANLDIFEKEKTLENLKPKIGILREGLDKIAKLPHVGDVRQRGVMVGIELVADKKTREPYPIAEKRGIRTILEARRRGVILRPLGNVIVLMPPLSITERELDRLLKVAYSSIKAATV